MELQNHLCPVVPSKTIYTFVRTGREGKQRVIVKGWGKMRIIALA